jgi:hypothetical protein
MLGWCLGTGVAPSCCAVFPIHVSTALTIVKQGKENGILLIVTLCYIPWIPIFLCSMLPSLLGLM